MYSIINQLPKAEHHLHLEGSIRPETLMWIADNSGLDNQWDSVEEINEFFEFKDFLHFLKVFSTCVGYITKEAMFERIAYEALEDQASQNVLHTEIISSATTKVKRAGMEFGLIMDAYNRGVSRAERDFGVTCATRIDLIRDYGPEYCMEELSWIEEYPEGIVAVELGGGEHDYPPAQFKKAYDKAREMDLRLVAHAGEVAGPESVIDAVNILGVERIGHGFTAKDSVEALELIKKKGVTIETCPVSNVRTGVCDNIGNHPVRKYFDSGISISVNSDDPTMFWTDMNNEYMSLQKAHDFTVPELYQVSLNTLKTSFLTEDQLEKHLEEFQDRYEKLEF
jgi:adenosine deaminase